MYSNSIHIALSSNPCCALGSQLLLILFVLSLVLIVTFLGHIFIIQLGPYKPLFQTFHQHIFFRILSYVCALLQMLKKIIPLSGPCQSFLVLICACFWVSSWWLRGLSFALTVGFKLSFHKFLFVGCCRWRTMHWYWTFQHLYLWCCIAACSQLCNWLPWLAVWLLRNHSIWLLGPWLHLPLRNSSFPHFLFLLDPISRFLVHAGKRGSMMQNIFLHFLLPRKHDSDLNNFE